MRHQPPVRFAACALVGLTVLVRSPAQEAAPPHFRAGPLADVHASAMRSFLKRQ